MLARTSKDFAGRLSPPPRELIGEATSLFLDFDGTLVEIADTPDAVIVDEILSKTLADLVRCLPGRVAVVSGRSARAVGVLLGTEGLLIAGSHGLEIMWGDGRVEAEDRPDALDASIALFERMARGATGLLVEEKPLGVALHYRLAPDREAECVALAERIADDSGLWLQRGKMMVELRAGGKDKGTAVRRLLAAVSMFGTRPIFLGDDITDESAFVAVREAGGCGILIGSPRETAALYRLDNVAEARQWLADACR